MPKLHRIQLPDMLYHVVTRGNNKQNLFLEAADFIFYLDLLFRFKTKYNILLFHFVLMTNHVHLMVQPTEDATLAKLMKRVNQSYTRYYQKRYHTTGHVWQGRYKSIPIESEAYYCRCARYIELNPVRAGIAHHPGEYEWSSYNDSIGRRSISWLDKHPLLLEMNRGGDAYRCFVEEDIIRAKMHKSESFSERPYYGKTVKFIKWFQE